MKASKKYGFRRPGSRAGSLRRRSTSYDAISGPATPRSIDDNDGDDDPDVAPPRHSPPLSRKLLRPLSALPVRGHPSTPFVHPLSRKTVSSSSSSRCSNLQLTGLSRQSSKERQCGREKSNNGNVIWQSQSSKGNLLLHKSPPPSRIPRPVGISRTCQLHRLDSQSKHVDLASQPLPLSPQSFSHHSSPEPSNIGRHAISVSPTNTETQTFLSVRTRQNLLYILKIAVLLLAIGVVLLIKITLFLGKCATMTWRALNQIVTSTVAQRSFQTHCPQPSEVARPSREGAGGGHPLSGANALSANSGSRAET